jgi:hypothetical protein
MGEVTDWQGIAQDRGRALQYAAHEYAELKHPDVTDRHEKAVLARLAFDRWIEESGDKFSEIRRKALENSGNSEDKA